MKTQQSNLNRSISEPDLNNPCFKNSFENRVPIARRAILVEEFISVPVTKIIRRGFTDSQIMGDYIGNFPVWQDIIPRSSNNDIDETDSDSSVKLGIYSQRKPYFFRRNSYIDVYSSDNVTPMDVDVSHESQTNKSTEKMEVDAYNDIEIDNNLCYAERTKNLQYSNRNDLFNSRNSSRRYLKEPRSHILHVRTTKKKIENVGLLLAIIPALLLIIFGFFFRDSYYVNSDVQLDKVRSDLFNSVHEQVKPLNIILESLEKRQYWRDKIKVLAFIGPSGVGKTFIANIMKQNFAIKFVHELYGSDFNNKNVRESISQEVQSYCSSLNLIIIDDIQRTDVPELSKFVHLLPKTCFTLVLAIFNIRSDTDNQLNLHYSFENAKIHIEFDKSDAYHEVIFFHEFDEVQVKSWIKKQLNILNIHAELQKRIMENVLIGHDIKYNGLKGLFNKLSVEVEKLNKTIF